MDENETHFFVLLNVWIIMAQVYTMNAQLLRYRQQQKKRKRNRNDADANIVAVIREGWDKAFTEMKKLSESFTCREAKARLPSELQAMGLPYDQVLRISMKLVKETDLMHIWCTLDDSHKPDFIKVFMDDF
ncbi:hypothetical protein C1H46_001425 [Malus baccata]|uniref:Uncharacterized protein n=1 Tax=Malus baccata TaxID=106549 RepID=A0A540NR61_MALBA|nr:hypothetical protein C1H46_001425 [Malus baccata]